MLIENNEELRYNVVNEQKNILLENVPYEMAVIFLSKINEREKYKYKIEACTGAGTQLLHD